MEGEKILKMINSTSIKSKWSLRVVITCIIIGLFLLIPSYNTYILIKFSSQLFDMDLPEDICVIEKYKIRGKLNGNGNGMDFFACILVETERSQGELQDYLNNQKFSPAKNHEMVETEVVKLCTNRLETKYVVNEDVVFETIKDEIDFDNYYVLIIYDGGYDSDFDIWGH